MKNFFIKKNFSISAVMSIVALLIFLVLPTRAETSLGSKLSGRILLQVENRGEAWYVIPGTERRVFLNRPADALNIMKTFGEYIASTELTSYLKSSFPKKLSGKILLNVDGNGEAYYVHPLDLKGYYLDKPNDAFKIMTELALGISNKDIISIDKINTLSIQTNQALNISSPVRGESDTPRQITVLTHKPIPMVNFSQIITVSGQIFGQGDIIEKGIVWDYSLNPDNPVIPTLEHNFKKISAIDSSLEKFDVDILGLVPETYPYVRAYAISHDNQVIYGETEAVTSLIKKSVPSLPTSLPTMYSLTYTATHGSLSGAASQTVKKSSGGSAIMAIPDTGYHFLNWSDGVTDNPRTDTNIISDLSVTAQFAINSYAVTYSPGLGGSLTGTDSQLITHGLDATTITAVPYSGYQFDQWSDGVTDNPRTDINVANSINVTAQFSITPFTCGNNFIYDSHGYQTIQVGTQCFFAENLQTGKYMDNSDIAYPGSDNTAWQTNTTGAYAWYNNDQATYGTTYGALYNVPALTSSHGLCPGGWHVPSDNEWSYLETYLGGANTTAAAIKSSSTWDGTNSSGLNFPPAGARTSTGGYSALNILSGLWASDAYSATENKYIVLLGASSNPALLHGHSTFNTGFTVRCLQN